MKQRIAVIGSGISGLGAAYILQDELDVTLYEKEKTLGGHARTIDINVGGQPVSVDTGFIVFNYQTYPHLSALFTQLNVPVTKSDMSFGVSVNNGLFEYGSSGLNSLFAQRRNLVNPTFLRMIRDIFTFNKAAIQDVESDLLSDDVTLADYLKRLNVSDMFINYYLLAMGAAIWSTPALGMNDFPAKVFIRFFYNHGLLQTRNHPQWYSVKGGSKVYIDKMMANFNGTIKTDSGVSSVRRTPEAVIVIDNNGDEAHYDQVIFATHSNQAVSILDDPTDDEQRILGNINYIPNEMVLHSDPSFMPRNRKAWSSWMYLANDQEEHNKSISLSYWMNNLQSLDTDEPIIVSINPGHKPLSSLTYDATTFDHPQFDEAALAAQRELPNIQGKDRIWFAGAYGRYGFHEDGLLSAVQIAEQLGVNAPWK